MLLHVEQAPEGGAQPKPAPAMPDGFRLAGQEPAAIPGSVLDGAARPERGVWRNA